MASDAPRPSFGHGQAQGDATPIKSALSNKIVTVVVGHDEVKWCLHENLLVSESDFFKASFRGPWKESKEGVLRLPEDEPRTFELFVGVSPQSDSATLGLIFGLLTEMVIQWAYSRPLAALSGNYSNVLPKPDGKTTIRDILNLYVFAAKASTPGPRPPAPGPLPRDHTTPSKKSYRV